MPNPFEFVGFVRTMHDDLKDMNDNLCNKLDDIIERLDMLVALADLHNKLDQTDFIKISGE